MIATPIAAATSWPGPTTNARRKSWRLIAVSAILVLGGGCGGPSAEELRDAARSLVPSGSEVLAEVEADCVELARSPSCVQIYFLSEARSRAERIAAVQQAARASDWETESNETFIGGTELRFRRADLQAFVHLVDDDRLDTCRSAPAKECADSLSVESI